MRKNGIKSNARDDTRKLVLLEILTKNDVYITQLIETNDGYVVLTSDEADLDEIFNNSTDNELRNQNFIPQTSPQLKANPSILLTKVEKNI